jgi:hypothetical protein
MLNKASAQQHVHDQVITLYTQLQQGQDVSPGERLRLEGQVELLLQFQLLDWPWLQQLINTQYQQHFHQPVNEILWQWMHTDQRFYLPVKMHEAPVYKNTYA